jgi:site-specific recombinase XerD
MEKFNAWTETTQAGSILIRYRDTKTGIKKTHQIVQKEERALIDGKWHTAKWLAEAHLQNLRNLYHSNKLGFSAASEPLEELVETYLEEKKNLAWKTLEHYESSLNHLKAEFSSTAELTLDRIREWKAKMTRTGIANNTLHGRLNDSSMFCRWLVKRKKLSESPFLEGEGLIPAQTAPKPRFYTTQEFMALDRQLEALNHHARVGCHLARDFGLRIVEIVGDGMERTQGVLWEDLIWKPDGSVDLLIRREVTKGQKKSRKAYLDADFIQMLGSRRTGPLVPLGRWEFVNLFEKARDQAGINPELTFHGLRHTFGKNFLQRSGSNQAALRDLLGHTDVKTTEIYSQFEDSYLEEATKKAGEKIREEEQVLKARGQAKGKPSQIIETNGNLSEPNGTNNDSKNDSKSGQISMGS